MPTEQPFSDPHTEARELLDSVGHWLASATFHIALGMLLGTVGARLLRRRHLHWSWAGAALLVILPAHALLPGGATLPLAALTVAVRGRRWHAHDLDAGADLARIAVARRNPLDALREALGPMQLRRLRALGPRALVRGEELLLGVDQRGNVVSVPFGEGAARHALVIGATGAGKTVTQTRLAVAALARGMGVVVIDPKGDRAMRDQLEAHAARQARRFISWSPAGPAVYNPYARGSESEVADKALAGELFTEPHYLRQAQRYMGHLVRALHAGELEVSLRRIVEQLDPERLELLARELPDDQARDTHEYLDSLNARQRRDLSGVRDRLAILAESDVGRWLDPESAGGSRFDLLEALHERAVVYFSLESDSRPLLSAMLGAAIVQDLQTAVAALQASPTPTLALIDEFSAIAAGQVVRLFGRARSAGLSVVLGTQELSDLRLPGRERLLEQVLGNLSTLIAHRQVVPDSAELLSRIAGRRGAWRTSLHSDGRATRTRADERVLDPDQVMGLAPGWAAVLVLEDTRPAVVARVLAGDGSGAGPSTAFHHENEETR